MPYKDKEKAKENYKRNFERIKAYQKMWREKNPEK